MACMEHVCRDCGHRWFDNCTHCICSECGSTNIANYFDEDPQEFPD